MRSMLTSICLVLLLSIFSVTGCGDDGDDSPGAENAPARTAQTVKTAATPRTITATANGSMIIPPAPGRLYHGVFPFSGSGEGEADITPGSVDSYEAAAGKAVAWVYFSNDWYQGRDFPAVTAEWIRDRGSVPYVRLMLRSSDEQNIAEPLFTMDNIIAGDFDEDLHEWFAAASDFATPLLLEFGTEVNGNWFSWNGEWNGGGETGGYGDDAYPDGPERFRDAYRHIIDISRQEGAANITWVFHFDRGDVPEEDWNRPEMYYPGDEWIDWLGLSVYGPTEPFDDEIYSFGELMDEGYARAVALSPDKPIIICEFGVTDGNPGLDQAQWADEALSSILSGRWPRLIGFSWWNEKWENDDDPAHDSRLMLQDNPALADVFNRRLGGSDKVLDSVRSE